LGDIGSQGKAEPRCATNLERDFQDIAHDRLVSFVFENWLPKASANGVYSRMVACVIQTATPSDH
jgi:hypothetical protein